MAPEAEGVEHLLCATCQQPAKLQCPRWCAGTVCLDVQGIGAYVLLIKCAGVARTLLRARLVPASAALRKQVCVHRLSRSWHECCN